MQPEARPALALTLLLLCSAGDERRGAAEEEELSTTPSTASLYVRIGLRRALWGRARRCARAAHPVRASTSDLDVLCADRPTRRRRRRCICGRGRRLFQPLIERGHPVGDQGGAELSSPAASDRSQAGQVSPLGVHWVAPIPAPLCARCGSVAFRYAIAAGICRSYAPPSAEPCMSRAAVCAFADVVPVCECLVMPTSGGASCLCAHIDARARRARRGARMSC